MLSSELAFIPANLFEKTPGIPLRALTSSPVSSAKQSNPVLSFTHFTFSIEFSIIVFLSSMISSLNPISFKSNISYLLARICFTSISLFGLCVANTNFFIRYDKGCYLLSLMTCKAVP